MDLVVVAPFDLSTALGVPGRFDAPDFVEAVSAIELAVGARGMPLEGLRLRQSRPHRSLTKGYRVLFHGFDVLMLKDQIGTFQTWT